MVRFARLIAPRGADFDAGRVVRWGYVGTPPRTLAYLCAHELTHVIAWEQIGLNRLHVSRWVWEGVAATDLSIPR